MAIPKNKRPGLKEVAEAAQTSVASASRVLNNTGYISEETRARVLRAALSLNYYPNLRAKELRQQRSHFIGLLIPNLLNTYYTTLADAISQLLADRGYQLMLSSTRDDPGIQESTLRQLIGHDVAGLIWVPAAPDKKLLKYLVDQHIPTVAIVRKVEGNLLDTIVFEDFDGSRAGTQHLIDLGHRRIAYIGGDIKFKSNLDRWQGFLKAIEAAGLPVDESLHKLGTLRATWGSIAAEELLSLPNPPTAIFVASNAIMAGVMRTLQQNRVRVPEEISLICFDDLDWFSFSNPPISAVATSYQRLAEDAIELLQRRIENAAETDMPPVEIRIGFELVVRRSTAALGQADVHPQPLAPARI
jgi:LacI family transcriptional regulator